MTAKETSTASRNRNKNSLPKSENGRKEKPRHPQMMFIKVDYQKKLTMC
jgi:hypothetical protein